jgi:hypothetical protein
MALIVKYTKMHLAPEGEAFVVAWPHGYQAAEKTEGVVEYLCDKTSLVEAQRACR